MNSLEWKNYLSMFAFWRSQLSVLKLQCYLQLQREEENAKTAIKKDKRREKEEKRKTRKPKGKTADVADCKVLKLTGEHEPQERSGAGSHFRDPQKSVKDEAELLEKSGITEEHGQPTWSPNGSSDSTWTSNKRKRDTSVTSNAGNHGEFGICPFIKECSWS